MQTRAAFAALLVLVAGSAWSGSVFAKGKKRVASLDSVRCPAFSQQNSDGGREIEFRIDNKCAMPLKCTLSWDVTCEGAAPVRHEESAEMAGAEGRTFRASAAVCGDAGWRISPATWNCRLKIENETAAR